MRCPSCKTDNPADAAFCEQCGSKLELICPACKAKVNSGARFCRKCGTAVVSVAAPQLKKSNDERIRVADVSASENLEAERKTVTALFADIKGSMELIEDLDPEEARAIVDPALKLMMEAVHHYGGYVAQTTGDGIFALFGAPIAQEDHPQRALYAALRMQEELKRYSDNIRSEGRIQIQVRVGVNTGEVLVRSIQTDEAHSEYTPIGHSISLASRMQALAPIGSIAATEPVRKLCEGYFSLRPLGPISVKGVSEPVKVYEVTGLGSLRTRLQRSAGRGYTRFVGREREIEALKHAADLAKQGHGQIVAAVGEPGVGKSRLFDEFKVKNQSGWTVLEAPSFSYGKASTYLPVIGLLRRYFGIDGEDNLCKRREKVSSKALRLDYALEGALPYLFGMLGLIEGDDPLAGMDTQVRHQRTLEAVARIMLRESLDQPVMVVFEDLHWTDEGTQAFLDLLTDSIGTSRILLLVNYRPEYSRSWANKTCYSQIDLNSLEPGSADEMLVSLIGAEAELEPLKRIITDKAEGNPFFLEEIVQALLEQGLIARDGAVKLVKPLGAIQLPATVQGVLASRIDRLPPTQRELLRTLAVIGNQFSLTLVGAVTAINGDDLSRLLSDLGRAEFIYNLPSSRNVEFRFKHALTHDVAYNSLLIEQRKVLHERTGAAIEVLFAGQIEDQLNNLADHYSRSANSTKAIEYLYRAGAAAAAHSAYADAVQRLSTGLDRLGSVADPHSRARNELDLRLAMLQAMQPQKGAGAPEVGELLTRARELCESVGDDWKLFTVLFGLRLFHSASNPALALEISRQMLTLAERAEDLAMTVAANYAVGRCLLDLGEFAEALAHFERAMAVPATELTNMPRFWGDPFVLARSLAGLTLCFLGYPNHALVRSREAVALARELGRPSTLVLSLGNDTQLNQLLHNVPAVLEGANAIAELSERIGFLGPAFVPPLYRGWTMVESGQVEDGIREMQRNSQARSAATAVGTVEILLADAYGKAGRAAEGLAILNGWLHRRAGIGARNYEAWTHCVAGELEMKQKPPDPSRAEERFHAAIEVARKQRAKWWELRATTSLARLLDCRGRRDEARVMLGDIYNWFTDGFDTPDLKDAKALLDELN